MNRSTSQTILWLYQLATCTLHAVVLMQVDVTDPAAAAFISTDAPSIVNDSSSFPLGGVVLLNLFQPGSPTIYENDDVALNGTLSVTGGGAPLEWALNEGMGDRHLNLYASGSISRPAMEFSTSVRAFTGLSVADLSAAVFAPVGTVGTIRTEDLFWGNDVVIGEFEIIGNPAATTDLRFQDDTTVWNGGPTWRGTQDTGLRLDAPTNNYGIADTVSVFTYTNDSMLIRFDLSSMATRLRVARVVSATLSLSVDGASGSGINTLDLFMIAPADGGWLEGEQDDASPAPGTGATYSHEVYDTDEWEGRVTGSPVRRTDLWRPVATCTLAAPPTANDTVDFRFYGFTEMELIKSWLEGGANAGFLVQGRGTGPTWNIRSRESVQTSHRPKLTLKVVLGERPGSVMIIR